MESLRKQLRKLPLIAVAAIVVILTSTDSSKAQERGDPGAIANDEATSLQSDLVAAYQRSGNLYLRLGYPDDAVRNFSRVIEFEPNNASAYLERGKAYLELSQQKSGVADLETAAALYQEQGDLQTYQEIQEILNKI